MSTKSNKKKSKFHFKDEWLVQKDYKDWIKKVQNDYHKAYCKVCMTTISIAGLGVSALDIHSKGSKHLLKCPAINQSKIQLTSSEKEKENDSTSTSKPINQSSIASFITKEETVKAEIR